MNTMVNWQNPYAQRDGEWLRGNLHTHTSPASGCGQVPLARTLDLYADAGYDFLSISDHMTLTTVADDRLLLIPGVEWNAPEGLHTGIYGPALPQHPEFCRMTSQEELLAAMSEVGGLVILNHPNWTLRPHYHRDELFDAGPYDGVEIFNGVIKRLDGYEIATDKWDYLLARGRRVVGYASDDFHCERDLCQGWMMVRCAERSVGAVLAALKAGNLYCSSGVSIRDIRREGDIIEVETEDAQEIQIIGEGGCLVQAVYEHSVRFDLRNTVGTYARFTAFGQGSAMAWTQPFFTA